MTLKIFLNSYVLLSSCNHFCGQKIHQYPQKQIDIFHRNVHRRLNLHESTIVVLNRLPFSNKKISRYVKNEIINCKHVRLLAWGTILNIWVCLLSRVFTDWYNIICYVICMLWQVFTDWHHTNLVDLAFFPNIKQFCVVEYLLQLYYY